MINTSEVSRAAAQGKSTYKRFSLSSALSRKRRSSSSKSAKKGGEDKGAMDNSAMMTEDDFEPLGEGNYSHAGAKADTVVELNVLAVRALCRFLTVLLRRWPQEGAPLIFMMLHTLALANVVEGRPPLLQCLWVYLQRKDAVPEASSGDAPVAALFCATLAQLLVVIDDSELYDDGKPFPLHQVTPRPPKIYS